MNKEVMKINNKRWIDLSYLPRHKSGLHIGKINWEESVGHKIPFYYRGIEGNISIIDYYLKRINNRNRFYLNVRYEDDSPAEITIDNIYRCRLGGILDSYVFPYKYKEGEKVNELEILEHTYIINSNKKKYRAYRYICNDCKYIGKAYIQEMDMKKCPKCGDGISYGEKFMYAILLGTGYNFETQYTFNWSKGGKNGNGRKKYDFYIPSKNCIIETHGIQHYPECGQDFAFFQGITSNDEVKNDKLKKEMALLNGILEERYIIIDCKKSEFDYIKNSILSNSKFMKLFSIKDINREYIESITMTNFRKRAVELYKSGYYISEISKKTKMSEKTIMRFLKKSADLYGYTYTSDKDRIENEKKEEVLGLFKEGNSRKYISEKTGVCYSSVNKILRQYKEIGECEYKTQSEQRAVNYIKASELFNSGLDEKQIAQNMKINDTTVVRYLIKAREEGFCNNYLSSSEIFEKNIKDSCDLYKEGKKPKEIEKILGLKKDRVYDYLAKGTEKGLCNYKRPNEVQDEKIQNVCDLYNKGFRVMEITRELNITKGTVRNYLKKGNDKGICIYPKIENKI